MFVCDKPYQTNNWFQQKWEGVTNLRNYAFNAHCKQYMIFFDKVLIEFPYAISKVCQINGTNYFTIWQGFKFCDNRNMLFVKRRCFNIDFFIFQIEYLKDLNDQQNLSNFFIPSYIKIPISSNFERGFAKMKEQLLDNFN